MALALNTWSVSFAGAALPVGSASRTVAPVMESVADLEKLADKLNPIVGYWNPLSLGETFTFWGSGGSSEETIGWLRHSEIKHGRVAMAAFVGFTVQSLGIHWPWNIEGIGATAKSFGEISAAGGPGDQWDAVSFEGKMQILSFVFLMEFLSESKYVLEKSGMKHYMRGGKPGAFPSIKDIIPHPIPFELFDPFGLQSKMTPERKESALLAELNNGRLAMIGIIGLESVSKGMIVPGLDSLPIAPYAGEYMKPFADFTF